MRYFGRVNYVIETGESVNINLALVTFSEMIRFVMERISSGKPVLRVCELAYKNPEETTLLPVNVPLALVA